jgi:hypothetical protein
LCWCRGDVSAIAREKIFRWDNKCMAFRIGITVSTTF